MLVGAGLYEAYTYSLQPSDPDPNAIELPVPLSQQQRLLRTTLTVGLLGAARHNVDMGNARRRALRGRARLPAGRAQGADRARACRRRSWQGDFFRAKGMVEAIFEALHVEPVFAATARARGLRRRCGSAGRLGGDLRAARSRRRVERVRARPRGAVRARAGAAPLPRCDHVSRRCARISRSSSTSRCRSGELLAAAREAAGSELRETRFLSRLPRRPDRDRQEVGRVLGCVPVARPHAVRRGRRRVSGQRSSPRSPGASAPSSAPSGAAKVVSARRADRPRRRCRPAGRAPS